MGRSSSSFFVGMAPIGYQRFVLCWSGFYVNFAKEFQVGGGRLSIRARASGDDEGDVVVLLG